MSTGVIHVMLEKVSYTCNVTHIKLYIYDVGVGVLILDILHRDGWGLFQSISYGSGPGQLGQAESSLGQGVACEEAIRSCVAAFPLTSQVCHVEKETGNDVTNVINMT